MKAIARAIFCGALIISDTILYKKLPSDIWFGVVSIVFILLLIFE